MLQKNTIQIYKIINFKYRFELTILATHHFFGLVTIKKKIFYFLSKFENLIKNKFNGNWIVFLKLHFFFKLINSKY